MNELLAIILGIHLNWRPPGMTKWRYNWRNFVLMWWWNWHRPLCDDNFGCVLTCPRLKKLREWEEHDNKEAFPKARLI